MNHFPFILGSYAVFVVLLLIDALSPWFARRTLVRELAQRLKRENRRAAQSPTDPESSSTTSP
ncbi:MAG: heme exporter protein CcmD [Ahniella sp.]|nr:heme exporter protein CcmD [Ahniella sp.]